ncbi:MAG TPA: YggS family pyridoxal phosphate-dependent enzyme [Micromonosporaceae bacterium]|nr:YggS family pyridoxal phosphate-dependent enzyme [Micromonosporaceae bacterium]
MNDARRAEIAANLDAVRRRIATACHGAGRDPSEITLIAVTKTRPPEDVVHLAALGVRDVGENRDQEAAPKAAAVRAAGVEVRWHFVGRLQRNKCPSVVRYADLVHSVDSRRLATALANASGRYRDRPMEVLVQVSLDGDPSRGGAVVDGENPDTSLGPVIDAVASAESLAFRGLMAVAPLEWEPERAFALLADIAATVRRDHPEATILSAGMSGDIEEAINYGATHVRVGSALLGNRPPPHVA